MRLSGVVVAVVFLFSSVLLAQHSSGGGGGSSGGSSGGGSHGSSGGSSSGASSSHTGSSGSGSSHSSGSHSSAGSSGSSNAHNSAHNSGSSSHGSSVAPRGSRSNASSHSATLKTAQPGKGSFFSFLRHPFHTLEKPTQSDLRRPVCKGEGCKKPAPKPPESAPALVESDLRRPVCKGKACACPPGEVQGKSGGCVAALTNNSACAVGQVCAASAHQCSANTDWNGTSCVARQADCATINARAASLANEVRAAKTQMQGACSSSSSAPECSGVKQNYDGAVERYRMLMNEAPANCRSLVPDPLSL